VISPFAKEDRQEVLQFGGHTYNFAHQQQIAYDPTLTGTVRIWLMYGKIYAPDAGYRLATISFKNGVVDKSGLNSDDRKTNVRR
jgi:hypothetical protein